MHAVNPVARVREICLALPEAVEQPFGGHTAPSFRIRGRLFVMTSEDGGSMTFKAGPGGQQALVAADPLRFFVPAYVGGKGWTGVRFSAMDDWGEIAELIEDSYRLIAPKRLTALLERPSTPARRYNTPGCSGPGCPGAGAGLA